MKCEFALLSLCYARVPTTFVSWFNTYEPHITLSLFLYVIIYASYISRYFHCGMPNPCHFHGMWIRRTIKIALYKEIIGQNCSQTRIQFFHIDHLVQDCSNSSADALELLQSCTKPSIYNQELILRWNFTSIGIPIIKIRQWKTRLIMAITIPGKMVFILKQSLGSISLFVSILIKWFYQ